MNREKWDRNDAILSMYAQNPNISLIARTFGITLTRVKQVLDKAGVRATKERESAGQYHGGRFRERYDAKELQSLQDMAALPGKRANS